MFTLVSLFVVPLAFQQKLRPLFQQSTSYRPTILSKDPRWLSRYPAPYEGRMQYLFRDGSRRFTVPDMPAPFRGPRYSRSMGAVPLRRVPNTRLSRPESETERFIRRQRASVMENMNVSPLPFDGFPAAFSRGLYDVPLQQSPFDNNLYRSMVSPPANHYLDPEYSSVPVAIPSYTDAWMGNFEGAEVDVAENSPFSYLKDMNIAYPAVSWSSVPSNLPPSAADALRRLSSFRGKLRAEHETLKKFNFKEAKITSPTRAPRNELQTHSNPLMKRLNSRMKNRLNDYKNKRSAYPSGKLNTKDLLKRSSGSDRLFQNNFRNLGENRQTSDKTKLEVRKLQLEKAVERFLMNSSSRFMKSLGEAKTKRTQKVKEDAKSAEVEKVKVDDSTEAEKERKLEMSVDADKNEENSEANVEGSLKKGEVEEISAEKSLSDEAKKAEEKKHIPSDPSVILEVTEEVPSKETTNESVESEKAMNDSLNVSNTLHALFSSARRSRDLKNSDGINSSTNSSQVEKFSDL